MLIDDNEYHYDRCHADHMYDHETVDHVKNIKKIDPLKAVYIGRDCYGHKDIGWGNPFKLVKGADRGSTLVKYEDYVQNNPELIKRLGELRGRTLLCWCKPQACHGDVLVKLVNQYLETNHVIYYSEDRQELEHYKQILIDGIWHGSEQGFSFRYEVYKAKPLFEGDKVRYGLSLVARCNAYYEQLAATSLQFLQGYNYSKEGN